jgi:hypothetical protein
VNHLLTDPARTANAVLTIHLTLASDLILSGARRIRVAWARARLRDKPAAFLEIVLINISLVKDEGLAEDHLAAPHLNRAQPPGLQRILTHAALHQ